MLKEKQSEDLILLQSKEKTPSPLLHSQTRERAAQFKRNKVRRGSEPVVLPLGFVTTAVLKLDVNLFAGFKTETEIWTVCIAKDASEDSFS